MDRGAQERGHARRPCARSAGVAGKNAGGRLRAAVGRPDAVGGLDTERRRLTPVQGSVERPIDAGNDPEERLVEEREGGPDLIDRTRRQPANRGRPPQKADLLAQLPFDFGVVNGPQTRIVKLLQEPVAAPQRRQHRSTSRLRRVRGQNRRNPHPAQQFGGATARPAALEQPPDCLRRRPLVSAPGGPLVEPQPAHRVSLLGQVDELEVQAERLCQRLGLGDIQRVELGGERVLGGFVPDLAEGDRAQPAPLDQIQQRRAALFGDDLTEKRTEQLDLARERVAGALRANRPRLLTPGCIPDDAAPGLAVGSTCGHALLLLGRDATRSVLAEPRGRLRG